MAWLTKSRFLSGRQCHKRLWFAIHQPLEQPVPPSVAILQGRAFDELVQRLEPGVVISRDRGMPAVAVGPQCDDPHPCPFLARCNAGRKLADFPVDLLARG
jgi:hypothetical protein